MKLRSLIALVLTGLMPLLMAAKCSIDTTITSMTAAANPTTIPSGGTSSLSATLTGTGTFNPTVNWSIISGGGSLSNNSGSSLTYTAPTVTTQTTVQIKAVAAGEPKATQTLTITVTPSGGGSKPVISSFTAIPASLPAGGGNTTLAWTVTGATSLSIDGGVGDVTGATSKSVAVTATKTFTLTATNTSGSSTSTVDVTVGTATLQPGVWDSSNWNEATWQ